MAEKNAPVFIKEAAAPAPSRVGNQYEYLAEAERQGAAAQAATIKGLGSFALDAFKGYAEAQVEKASVHAARNLVNTDANYIGEDVKARISEVGVATGAIADLEKARDTYGESPDITNPQIKQFKEKIDAITGSQGSGALTPQEARLYVANEIKKWGAILPGYLDDFRKVAKNVTGVDNLDGVDIHTAFTLKKEDTARKRAAELREWQVKKVYEDVIKNPGWADKPAAALKEAERLVDASPEVQATSLNLQATQAVTNKTVAITEQKVAVGKQTLDDLTGMYNVYRTTDPQGNLGVAPATKRMYTEIAMAEQNFRLYNADGSVNVMALQANADKVMAEMGRIKNDFLSNVQKAHDNGIMRMRLSAGNVPQGELDKQITVLENNHRAWREANERKLNDTDHWLDTLKAISSANKERAETRQAYMQTAQALASLSGTDFVTKYFGATTQQGFVNQYPWAGGIADAINYNVRAGTGASYVTALHAEAAKAQPDANSPVGKDAVITKIGNGEVSLERGIAGKEDKTLTPQQKQDVLYYAQYADYARSPAQLDKLLQGGDEKKLAAHLGDPELAKNVIKTVSDRLLRSVSNPTTEGEAFRESFPTQANRDLATRTTTAAAKAVEFLVSLIPGSTSAQKRTDVPQVVVRPDGGYDFAVRVTGKMRGKDVDKVMAINPTPDQRKEAERQLDGIKARVSLYNKMNPNAPQLDFQTVINNMLTPPEPKGNLTEADKTIPTPKLSKKTEAQIAIAERRIKELEDEIGVLSEVKTTKAQAMVKNKTEEVTEARASLERIKAKLRPEQEG